jgi:hypothetical protein
MASATGKDLSSSSSSSRRTGVPAAPPTLLDTVKQLTTVLAPDSVASVAGSYMVTGAPSSISDSPPSSKVRLSRGESCTTGRATARARRGAPAQMTLNQRLHAALKVSCRPERTLLHSHMAAWLFVKQVHALHRVGWQHPGKHPMTAGSVLFLVPDLNMTASK